MDTFDFFEGGPADSDDAWTDALRAASDAGDEDAFVELARTACEAQGRIARLVRELYSEPNTSRATLRARVYDALSAAAGGPHAVITGVDADEASLRRIDDEDDAAADYGRDEVLAARHRAWEWLEGEIARTDRDSDAWLTAASRRVDSLVWTHSLPAAIELGERVARTALQTHGTDSFEYAEATVRLASVFLSANEPARAVGVLETGLLIPLQREPRLLEGWGPRLSRALLTTIGAARFASGSYRSAFSAWEEARQRTSDPAVDFFDRDPSRPAPRRVTLPPIVTVSETAGDKLSSIAGDIRSCVALGGIGGEALLSNLYRSAAELARQRRIDDEAIVREHADRWVDDTIAEGTEFARETIVRAGEYLQNNGEYAEAARILGRLLEQWPEDLDPEGRAVAIQHRGLALLSADDAAATVALLAPLVDALGDADDPDARLLRGNFAAALLRANRASDALPLYRDLASRAHDDGNEDERDLMEVCAAESLLLLGRREEARDLFATAVDRCATRGALASATGARGTDGLVSALLALNDDRAIDAQQRMLDATRAMYGADHPGTWLEEGNLAIVLAQRGRRDEAIERFAATLARQEQTFGATSADAIRTRKNLALLFREMGRDAEAERLEAALPELESRAVTWEPLRPLRL